MLIDEIQEKLIYLGDGLVDASTLLNHKVEVDVLSQAAEAFAAQFKHTRVDKVLTLEVSGIIPALLTATQLSIPLVYARKGRRMTQQECYESSVKSRTAGNETLVTVDNRMLEPGECVLIVDDFLARGEAIRGLLDISRQAQAKVVGVCAVFTKMFEQGLQSLDEFQAPVLSYLELHLDEDQQLVVKPGKAFPNLW